MNNHLKRTARALDFLPGGTRSLPGRCSLSRVFFVLWLALVGVAMSTAQTLRTSGTLEGTISDATGGRIPGVKVSLRQIETNQARTVYTDDGGFFRATDLPVSSYEVRIEDERFVPYLHTGVAIGVGITTHLDVVLQAAGVTTQVTVSAQPPPIDPSQTSVTSSVDREKIEDLPVRSRNALDFVLLMPGVTSSSQQGGTGSHAALADSGFTFGGLRPRSNNISVDGLYNKIRWCFGGLDQRCHAHGCKRRPRRRFYFLSRFLAQCSRSHRKRPRQARLPPLSHRLFYGRTDR